MIIPAAAWLPDQPSFPSKGAATVKNCLPRSEGSYGPMPGLTAYSNALGARCQGAVGVTDSDGNAYAFAGTASKLYKAEAGSTSWSDVAGAAYVCPADERWAFAFYTPNRVLAANISDAIQSFVIGTSAAFADLSASAPKARYLATIRDFVMAGNTFDAVDGNRPTRVWWPEIGVPTSWPTPGTAAAAAAQSDFQDLNIGDFGWVTGLVGGLGSADGVVVFERGIARIAYQGPPTIFGFYPIEGARGTIAPGSIAQLGAVFFYLGDDDVYLCDGASSVPLGAEQWATTVLDRMDQTYLHRVTAAFDPLAKIYYLAYPGPDNQGGNPNEVLAYNWSLKRGALIDSLGGLEVLFRSVSFGYTLDTLDSASGSVDALPFGLDSRAWAGGSPLLSAINSDHKLCYFTGDNLAPTVETPELQLRRHRAFLSNVKPLVDGGTPSIALGTRERLVDTKTWGSAVQMDQWGNCPQMSEARYHTARLTLPAGSSFSHISGVDIPDEEVVDAGER